MKPILIIFGSMSVGLILEGLRLSGSPKNFLKALLMGFLLSLASLAIFLPAKALGYHGGLLLILWPSFFIVGLVIGTFQYMKDSVRPKLGEGLTLISTISFLYFLSEIFRMYHPSRLWLVILPSLFTFLCAFTSLDLSRGVRLFLSLWNTFIHLIFGIFMVLLILRPSKEAGAIPPVSDPMALFMFCFQYAMLGAASIYISYNLYMLIGFLPPKKKMFSKEYQRQIKKMIEEHLGRYSTVQINPAYALLIVFLHGGPLMANYLFHFASPLFMFWYSLSISPLIVQFVIRLISGEKFHPLPNPPPSRGREWINSCLQSGLFMRDYRSSQ